MAERQRLLEKRLKQWLPEMGLEPKFLLTPASADASFRRYFRVSIEGKSFVAMDAPPAHEDCRPFVAISQALVEAGLHVPEVLKMDLEQGFLLLTDLGEQQYLQVLETQSVELLYADAMQALIQIQKTQPPAGLLPIYSHELLLKEMSLFQDWFVAAFLEVRLPSLQQGRLAEVFELLAQQALVQTQVWVHRDYHSRNLMWIKDGAGIKVGEQQRLSNPGILDFQDAVIGPVCYDLVSLLRDCYISWPRQQVRGWVEQYRLELIDAGLLPMTVEAEEFQRWFDWMGVQRHLKAMGIFARLHIRDGKSGYLADIPRTLLYVLQVSRDYQQLNVMSDWLEQMIVPLVTSALSLEEGYFRAD